MKIDIDANQSVFVDCYGNVRFCHYSSTDFPHLLKLNYHQFLNFNDVLRGLKHFSHLSWHPLSQGLWFYKKNNVIKLVDNTIHCFFQFYAHGWSKYKSHAHNRILSFLRHGSYATDHQYYARNESRPKHRFGRRVSTLSRRKHFISRTTRNVGDDYESEQAKSPTFPRRKNTNSRPHPKPRGGKHAARDYCAFEESSQDGDVSSVDSDNHEYGREPTVAISD